MKKEFNLIELMIVLIIIGIFSIFSLSFIFPDEKEDKKDEKEDKKVVNTEKVRENTSVTQPLDAKVENDWYTPATIQQACGNIPNAEAKSACEKEFTQSKNIQDCIERYSN